MQKTFSTPAISLRSRAFKEQDLLVDVYTLEQGKLSLMVKGGRKLHSKMAGHLEPFILLELMVIAGKNIPTAAAASSRNSYQSLKSDFDKIAAAGWAISQFNKLVKEGERDDRLFHALSDFLALLNEAQAEKHWYQWFAKIFLLLVLKHLGYGAEKIPFTPPTSLYEAARQTFSRAEFEKINCWLDRFLPAAIENAL